MTAVALEWGEIRRAPAGLTGRMVPLNFVGFGRDEDGNKLKMEFGAIHFYNTPLTSSGKGFAVRIYLPTTTRYLATSVEAAEKGIYEKAGEFLTFFGLQMVLPAESSRLEIYK